jgi:hypothetical protein
MDLRRICDRPRRAAPAAAALCLLAFLTPAMAAPLDKDACEKLAQDMQNMKMLEVDKLMEKGAAWAASNLSESDLTLVRQYIGLDEQIKFRCTAPGALVHLKRLDDEDDDNGKQSAAGEGKKNQAGDGQAEEAAPAAAPAKHKAANAPAKKPAPAQQQPQAQPVAQGAAAR